MSSCPSSQFSLAACPRPAGPQFGPQLPDVSREPHMATSTGAPRKCVYDSDFSIITPTTENGHCFRQIPVTHPSPPELISVPWHTNQAHTAPFTPPYYLSQQTRRDPTLWSSTRMPMITEPSPIPALPTAVKTYGNDSGTTSASRSTYDTDPYGSYWADRIALYPSYAHPLDSSDKRFRYLPVEQDIRDSKSRVLGEPSSAYPFSSHTDPSAQGCREDVADSLTTHHLPSHEPLIPHLPHWPLGPTSPGYPEVGPRFRFVFPGDPISPSRHKRRTRAIEYDGLWIDEEELLEGLSEPGGKINVHQCHWEEDRTPCRLWISSDRSHILRHIQRWHGGRPGGDKLEVDCRWSSCGQRMLKESIPRHILSIHLGEMWECQGCGKGNARKDAYRRHVVRSDFEACRTAGALIIYSAEARVIDARAALEGRGSLRYADA